MLPRERAIIFAAVIRYYAMPRCYYCRFSLRDFHLRYAVCLICRVAAPPPSSLPLCRVFFDAVYSAMLSHYYFTLFATARAKRI